MPDDPQLPEMLDVAAVAKWLQMSPSKVCRLAAARVIPAKKLGKNWRFCVATVAAWAQIPEKGRRA